MKIKTIKAVNFKGRSFSDNLKPITVFVGNNFTGKSSRVEAITLALAGYLPGIEKLPGKIAGRLASGNPMTVSVEFDDGRIMGREYRQDGTGKVSVAINQRGFSAAFAVEPCVVDSLEFLGLSSQERVKFLVNKLPLTGEVAAPSSLFEKLGKAAIASSEDAAMLISSMESEAIEDHERAVTAGLSPQMWLDSLGLNQNERRKRAQARSLELAKANKVANENQQPMIAYSRSKIDQRVVDATAAKMLALDKLNDAKVKQRSAQSNLNDQAEARAHYNCEQALKFAMEKQEKCERELAEVEALPCCPKCGAKNKGWQEKIKSAVEKELAGARKGVEVGNRELAKAAEALRVKQQLIVKVNATQIQTLHEELAAAQSAFDKAMAGEEAAEAGQMAMQRQDEEIKRREKSRKEAISVNTEVEVLKAFCVIIQASLDAMVTQSIVPFVARINLLCGDILPHPIAYQNGELGMDIASHFVTWRSFSGTEKALFQCAVSLALAAESEIKLAVLDEVGRLDAINRHKLIESLDALIREGVIEQAIMIDAGPVKAWKGMLSDDEAIIEIK